MHRSSTVYNENSPKPFKTNRSVDFNVRGQQGIDLFHWGSVILDYKLVFCLNDGFVSYKHAAFFIIISQDINWWTGVVWMEYLIFLSAVLTLWRHPFTEDLLVSTWCNDTFLQIFSDEQANSSTSWMAWGWVHFQQIFILGKLFLN